MKRSLVLAFASYIVSSGAFGQQHQAVEPLTKPMRVAVICFKTGERISGMNKICYYNCLGSEAAITISSVELCPLSIDR